jgi:hypothetical protein
MAYGVLVMYEKVKFCVLRDCCRHTKVISILSNLTDSNKIFLHVPRVELGPRMWHSTATISPRHPTLFHASSQRQPQAAAILNFNTSLQSSSPTTNRHHGSSIFPSRKSHYPNLPASSANHQPRTSSRCSLSSPYPACAWYNKKTLQSQNNSDEKWHNSLRYVSTLF